MNKSYSYNISQQGFDYTKKTFYTNSDMRIPNLDAKSSIASVNSMEF
jgi:hypothetical protein